MEKYFEMVAVSMDIRINLIRKRMDNMLKHGATLDDEAKDEAIEATEKWLDALDDIITRQGF